MVTVLGAEQLLTPDMWEWFNTFQEPLFREMHEKWGIPKFLLDIGYAAIIMDTYWCLKVEGAPLTVPDLSPEAYRQVDKLMGDVQDIMYALDVTGQLAADPFLDFMVSTLQQKVDTLVHGIGDYHTKMVLTLAHDSSMAAFLAGLQTRAPGQVDFACNLNMELW